MPLSRFARCSFAHMNTAKSYFFGRALSCCMHVFALLNLKIFAG